MIRRAALGLALLLSSGCGGDLGGGQLGDAGAQPRCAQIDFATRHCAQPDGTVCDMGETIRCTP